MSMCSSAFVYARATSLYVLPSRIRMKLDWPGLELITDTKTTPENRQEEVNVKREKQNVKCQWNHVRCLFSDILLLQNTTQHTVLSGQMWSVSVILRWYLSPAIHRLSMHTTKCPHHHPLILHLVQGQTQALMASSCPRSSKVFLLFLCQTLQSKENGWIGKNH